MSSNLQSRLSQSSSIGRVRQLSLDLEHSQTLQMISLAMITLLAAVMRFFKLGAWSFWIDELTTIFHAQNFLNEIFNLPPPPVSTFLIHLELLYLPANEWSSRLVPALIGIITIPILFFLIRSLFDSLTALLAVLLLAFSPWHLYWSQSSRFYTSLLLFYSLAMFSFFYGLEKDRFRYILLSILFFVLAFLERFTAGFLVPIAAAYLILVKFLPFEKPKGLNARNMTPLLVLALAGLGVLAVDGYLFATTGKSYVIAQFEWFVDLPIDDPIRLTTFAVFNLGIGVVVLSLFSGIYLVLNRSRQGLYIFLGAFLPLLILAVITPFIFTQDRYVFMTLPNWAILAGFGVRELYRRADKLTRWIAIGVFCVLLAESLSSHLLYYTVNHGNRLDWRNAFAIVADRQEAGDRFVSTHYRLGDYYLKEDVMDIADFRPEMAQQGAGRTWFVLESNKVWATPKQKKWIETNAHLTNFLYLRTPEENYLSVYLYDPAHP